MRHLRLALGVVVDETNLAKALESCFVKTVALHIGEYGADQLSECSANVIIASEMQHKMCLPRTPAVLWCYLLGSRQLSVLSCDTCDSDSRMR